MSMNKLQLDALNDVELASLFAATGSFKNFSKLHSMSMGVTIKYLRSRNIGPVHKAMSSFHVKDLKAKYSLEDLTTLLNTHTYEELATTWGCNICTVYELAEELSVSKRVSQEDILKKYSKTDLEKLYSDTGSVRKVAKQIGCNPATLRTVFETEGIPIIGFIGLPAAAKVLGKLDKDTLEKQLAQYSIKEVSRMNNVASNQLVVKMKELGITLGGGVHHKNRTMLAISDNVFKADVAYKGVLATAKEWGCSQSAVRDRANALGITLVAGPHKALTSTPAWIAMATQNGLNSNIKIGAKGYKNTSIEIATQEYLTKKGVAYQLHPQLMSMTVPDLYVDPMVAIYVDGCYWHGCPTCNVSSKFRGLTNNQNRDKYVNVGLAKAGYKVVRIWEHDIKAGDFSALDFLLQPLLSVAIPIANPI